MPKVRRSSYNLAFKLKVVAEAEAVENNSEIARDYGISESMVRRWRKDQANLFNGELKMSAKRKTMGCYSPKYPELDQTHTELTVTLAVAADGKKLPPSVIFKGVRTPRDLAVPDTVRVSFHKKGWMDEKGRNLSHFYFIAHW